jgi:hypothetical protein
MKDVLTNSTQIANLLIFREMIAELASFCKSTVCFRMIGIWRNSGGQEPVNFGSLEEPQFGILDEW